MSARALRYPVPLKPDVELMVRRLLADPDPVPMAELLALSISEPDRYGHRQVKRTTEQALAWLLKTAGVIEITGRAKWNGAAPKSNRHGAFVIDTDHAAVTVTDEPGLRAILRVWPRTDPRAAAPKLGPAPQAAAAKPLQLVWHDEAGGAA